jgi:hypothetical protein
MGVIMTSNALAPEPALTVTPQSFLMTYFVESHADRDILFMTLFCGDDVWDSANTPTKRQPAVDCSPLSAAGVPFIVLPAVAFSLPVMLCGTSNRLTTAFAAGADANPAGTRNTALPNGHWDVLDSAAVLPTT